MADCAELSKLIHENILLIAETEDVKNLDDAILRFQEGHPKFHRDAVVQAMNEASMRQERQVSDLSKKLSAIKRQAKTEKALKDKITELEEFLSAGALPEHVVRAGTEATYAIDQLKAIRDGLKKQLAQSDPSQRAKVEKQIADLEEKIKSGEITPKQKAPELMQSKELDRALYERDLLKEEWRNKIYGARPVTIWGRIGDVFDLKRLFQTTLEMSYALRQGGAFAGAHPIQATEATLKSLRALVDPIYRHKAMQQILADEDTPLAHRVGLRIVPIGTVTSLNQQEEYMMSRFSERIPVIREFTQAGIVLLNLIRLGHFKTLYHTAGITEKGMPIAQAKFLADAVNVFSGRPSLGKAENVAVGMNRVFYAFRWFISRWEVLYGQPIWHNLRQPGTLRLNPDISLKARAVVAAEYARFFASLAAFYSLAMLGGGEPDDDRHSSTFGQVRFGNKYIDPTMGIGRIIALHFQLAEGLKKSDALDKEKKLSGYTKFVEIARYGRQKLGPLPGDIVDFVVGETVTGEEATITQWFKEFPPITWRQVYEVMTADQEVDENSALSVLSFFGESVSVHDEDNKKQTTRRRTSARR